MIPAANEDRRQNAGLTITREARVINWYPIPDNCKNFSSTLNYRPKSLENKQKRDDGNGANRESHILFFAPTSSSVFSTREQLRTKLNWPGMWVSAERASRRS